MQISILMDDNLIGYCFPQDYLSSPYNIKGRKIISLAEGALNKELFDLEIGHYENTWFYMRCAYNWDNEIYYFKVNDNIKENEVIHEYASDNHPVDYPFKFLYIEYEKYPAYIQNANLNENCEIYHKCLKYNSLLKNINKIFYEIKNFFSNLYNQILNFSLLTL